MPPHPPVDSANPAFQEPRSASPLPPLGSSLVRPADLACLEPSPWSHLLTQHAQSPPPVLPADSAYEPRQACAIDLSRYNCRRQRGVTQITGGEGGRGEHFMGRGGKDSQLLGGGGGRGGSREQNADALTSTDPARRSVMLAGALLGTQACCGLQLPGHSFCALLLCTRRRIGGCSVPLTITEMTFSPCGGCPGLLAHTGDTTPRATTSLGDVTALDYWHIRVIQPPELPPPWGMWLPWTTGTYG